MLSQFNAEDFFVVSLDRKRSTATIFKPSNLTYSMYPDDIRMEMSINKMIYGVDLDAWLYKFGTSINEVSEEDILCMLNEGGCFESNKYV